MGLPLPIKSKHKKNDAGNITGFCHRIYLSCFHLGDNHVLCFGYQQLLLVASPWICHWITVILEKTEKHDYSKAGSAALRSDFCLWFLNGFMEVYSRETSEITISSESASHTESKNTCIMSGFRFSFGFEKVSDFLILMLYLTVVSYWAKSKQLPFLWVTSTASQRTGGCFLLPLCNQDFKMCQSKRWFHTALNNCKYDQTSNGYRDYWRRTVKSFSARSPFWRSCSSAAAQFGENQRFWGSLNQTGDELKSRATPCVKSCITSPSSLHLALPLPASYSPVSSCLPCSSSSFRSVKIPPPSSLHPPQKSSTFYCCFYTSMPHGCR